MAVYEVTTEVSFDINADSAGTAIDDVQNKIRTEGGTIKPGQEMKVRKIHS